MNNGQDQKKACNVSQVFPGVYRGYQRTRMQKQGVLVFMCGRIRSATMSKTMTKCKILNTNEGAVFGAWYAQNTIIAG